MGRPQFAQVGTKGGGEHVATQDRPDPEVADADQTTTVASNSAETIEVYAPTGSTYEVENLRLEAQDIGSATTGRHRMFMWGAPATSAVAAFDAKSNYDSRLLFSTSTWTQADVNQVPADSATMMMAIQSMRATDSTPVHVKYINNTDADQTKTRKYRIYLTEASY